MRYDATLKKLFHQPPNKLLTYVLGKPVVVKRMLPTELITVANLHPDLLFETLDGGLLHTELHGYAMAEFARRNLLYYALLLRDYGRHPIQIVFWVGKERVGVTGGLSNPPNLEYSYRVIDVRDIDAAFLLDGGGIGESIFAILCKFEDKRQTIAEILRRIGQLPEAEQKPAIAELLILSGLRDLQPVVREEIARMPLTFDIHENGFLEEVYTDGFEKGIEKGIEQGQQKGRIDSAREILLKLVIRKFGPLPSSLDQTIGNADLRQISTWTDRVIDSTSLEAVFSEK